MRILGIETSCDETAVCVIEATGAIEKPEFKVLGNALYSQTKIHEQYGGVFPMMAKREHAKNLVPLLVQALKEAGDMSQELRVTNDDTEIKEILEREPELFEMMKAEIFPLKKPDIEYIAVTFGPGLEPALWVGINFAKALSKLWDIPIIPINHMEGHLVSVLFKEKAQEDAQTLQFPALAALISGGHTQLVVMENWLTYKIVGDTRDDAAGEAFDKVARMLGLPYPGGPHISRLAAEDRIKNGQSLWKLPRPMINTDDFDFSFSGLKTAVLYTLKKLPHPDITPDVQSGIAREFEEAVTEVLKAKIERAMEKFRIKTLIIGGGVSANKYIREELRKVCVERDIEFLLPTPLLSTDNAIMIACAGYLHALTKNIKTDVPRATGNAKISA